MSQPHKHRDVIIAWANGAQIQFLDGDKWINCHDHAPRWHEEMRYRVKPKIVKREGWVNVYRRHIHETKDQADASSAPGKITCIRIEWEEEE